jgi:aminoglycoside phosphotransferase (APT) family kinase protein
MTAGGTRDLDGLGGRLERWLGERSGAEVRALAVRHASSGWSNETILVDCLVEGTIGGPLGAVLHSCHASAPVEDLQGGHGAQRRRLVVRVAPLSATFPDDDLAVQGRVQEAVNAAGVPAPAPTVVESDERWLGAPFLVMPFVEGHVPGEVAALDPWITESSPRAQAALLSGFVTTLASVHRLDWRAAGLGGALRGAEGGLEAEIGWWDGYVRWSSQGRPFAPLLDGLAWCRSHRPTPEPPPSLLSGDPRLGNVVVGEDRGIRAVLDWDMALIGPAEMDLGWFLALQWSAEELLQMRVAGFESHDGIVARYEQELGRPVRDLDWYEVFALVRSLAVSNHQARAARAAGRRAATPPDEGNPLVGLLERRMAPAR